MTTMEKLAVLAEIKGKIERAWGLLDEASEMAREIAAIRFAQLLEDTAGDTDALILDVRRTKAAIKAGKSDV